MDYEIDLVYDNEVRAYRWEYENSDGDEFDFTLRVGLSQGCLGSILLIWLLSDGRAEIGEWHYTSDHSAALARATSRIATYINMLER